MYGFGVIGPDPRRSWFLIAGGAIVMVVFLAVATGALVVPGWVGIGLLRWAINTPRGVGVADQGVFVTRESFWNARPKSIVARLPFDSLWVTTGSTKTHTRVQLGSEQIWLRRSEHEILVAAANSAFTQPQAPATHQ